MSDVAQVRKLTSEINALQAAKAARAEERLAPLKRLRAAGATYTELGELIGVHESTVKTMITGKA